MADVAVEFTAEELAQWAELAMAQKQWAVLDPSAAPAAAACSRAKRAAAPSDEQAKRHRALSELNGSCW